MRYLLGAIFVLSSLDKVAHPWAFIRALGHYRLLPSVVLTPVGYGLPWLELVGGLLVVTGPYRRAGAWILATLSGLFLLATSSAILRHLDIGCGCFHGTNLSWYHPLLNLILLAITVAVVKTS